MHQFARTPLPKPKAGHSSHNIRSIPQALYQKRADRLSVLIVILVVIIPCGIPQTGGLVVFREYVARLVFHTRVNSCVKRVRQSRGSHQSPFQTCCNHCQYRFNICLLHCISIQEQHGLYQLLARDCCGRCFPYV